MGGIGYTNVFPVERIVRDLRLASIWTGTNEIMAVLTAHEWCREYADGHSGNGRRNVEADAGAKDADDEKVYE